MSFDQVFGEIESVLKDTNTDSDLKKSILQIINKNRRLTFKTIQELRSLEFIIPDYQRGYRWTKQQVEDLLEDILEFSKTNPSDDQFYCLQPVIVKKSDEAWTVVDGQQRLTTIYLILKYLDKEEPYKSFAYKTREDSEIFLKELKSGPIEVDEIKNVNIDINHFKGVIETIREWFESKEKEKYNPRDNWKTTLLNKTKVIWYNPESKEEENNKEAEINIFSRINSGKIPLTNSELIRALFIHNSKVKANPDASILKQQKIASEWDFIEQQLHDENFWCFVTLGNPFKKKEYSNRIEFFFDLVEKISPDNDKKNKEDNYSTFRLYNKWIDDGEREVKNADEKENVDTSFLWQEIKNLYYRFHEWFIDCELYHLTGFVREQEISKVVDLLWGQFSSATLNQTQFSNDLKGKIIKSFRKEGKSTDCPCLRIRELDYRNKSDKNLISRTLLLSNIAQIVNPQLAARKSSCASKKRNVQSLDRFDFRAYKSGKWDIEHIRSQTPSVNKQEEWLKAVLKYWGTVEPANDLREKICKALTGSSDIKADAIKAVRIHFDELDKNGEELKFETHNIGNLCLLDSNTNRGYGNAVFPVKRNAIIDRIASGTFIPPFTQHVFLKFHSKQTDQMFSWLQKDADDYTSAICSVICKFLEVK